MSENLYDLIIIGGGPAGLSAGIYGGRARMKTLIIEKGSLGGRAFTTREIVNYPGYKETTGPDLMKDMAEHAQAFGVEVKKEEVKSAPRDLNKLKEVLTSDFDDIYTPLTKEEKRQLWRSIIDTLEVKGNDVVGIHFKA